jgi:hypothetical protein
VTAIRKTRGLPFSAAQSAGSPARKQVPFSSPVVDIGRRNDFRVELTRLIECTGCSGGRRYLEGVEDCAHGVINAGEYDGFHDPFGTERFFCLAVERLA